MTNNLCKLYEHIFSVNDTKKLVCEKCNKTYPEYLEDVETHKNEYRFGSVK